MTPDSISSNNSNNFNKTKRRIIFRLLSSNRLSFPVLLNAWEKYGLDKEFDIITREEPLCPGEIQTGDVILFSFMTPVFPEVHREIAGIKQSGKRDILIGGGGPHITGEQELSREAGFDVLFTGPGERSFLQFGTDLLDNKPIPPLYESSESTHELHELTRIKDDPGDDFNRFIPVSKYIKTIPPLEIMRGCYWNCTYCSTPMHNVRFRTMDSVGSYLQAMKDRGLKRINYISPSSMEFGGVKGRDVRLGKIEELLELTHKYRFRFVEYGIFPSEVRPDTVTEEGMKLLKKYVSNKHITLGAQSGLDSRLQELRRGHTIEDIETAIRVANSVGFSVQLDFIIGYPGETGEERETTVLFITRICKRYKVRAHLHYFIPLSGSPYGFRFPSYLSNEEKEALYRLQSAGIAIAGWIANEKQVLSYFEWLRENFPRYYSKYY